MEDEIEVFDENLEDEIEIQDENIYYIPNGQIDITENGQHDVAKYSQANVNVQPPKDIIEITENGLHDVAEYKQANVQTPGYGWNEIFKPITNENSLNYFTDMFAITPEFTVENATEIENMFSSTYVKYKSIIVRFKDCTDVTATRLFRSSYIEDITLTSDTPVILRSNTFDGCNAKSIKLVNIKKNHQTMTINYSDTNFNIENLVDLDVGIYFNQINEIAPVNYTLNIKDATNLSHDSIMNIINAIPKKTSSKGLEIEMGETNLAKLSDEEKQMITDKGWTYE